MCAGTSIENSANNTPPENHSPENSSQRIPFPLYLEECLDPEESWERDRAGFQRKQKPKFQLKS